MKTRRIRTARKIIQLAHPYLEASTTFGTKDSTPAATAEDSHKIGGDDRPHGGEYYCPNSGAETTVGAEVSTLIFPPHAT